MAKIKFGTDGWRAIIGEDFTFENVRIVTQAIADFINSQKSSIYGKKKVLVGYDTRFLSDKFAEAIACVLAANGMKVILSDNACSTPAVSFYIKNNKLTGGVMVTASHNPAAYNGIKYKGFFGGSAGTDIIEKIEKKLHKNPVKTMGIEEAREKKKVVCKDITKEQIDFIRKYADMKALKKKRFKVLVDSMNGVGGTYLRDMLKGTNIRVDFINAERNPGFRGIAPEPKLQNLKELIKRVKSGKYDLGVATDGDADRVAIVDEKGNLLSGHKLMALLLLHLHENRGMRGGVVQTICGTVLINKICEKYGIKMHETPVGFKYICELMTKEDILIGGEETGGIGFKDYIPERDSFLSAMLVMELMANWKESLSEVVDDVDKEYGKFVYARNDCVFPEEKRKKLLAGMKKDPLKSILNKKVVDIKDYDGTKFICEDGSWMLLRLSGTEPKLRIYSETNSKKNTEKYALIGKKYAFRLMK